VARPPAVAGYAGERARPRRRNPPGQSHGSARIAVRGGGFKRLIGSAPCIATAVHPSLRCARPERCHPEADDALGSAVNGRSFDEPIVVNPLKRPQVRRRPRVLHAVHLGSHAISPVLDSALARSMHHHGGPRPAMRASDKPLRTRCAPRSGVDEVQRTVGRRERHPRSVTPVAKDRSKVGAIDALVGVDVGGGAVALSPG
jgi:hypothetical protein